MTSMEEGLVTFCTAGGALSSFMSPGGFTTVSALSEVDRYGITIVEYSGVSRQQNKAVKQNRIKHVYYLS
jgi:hypothetical protein